MIWGLKQNSSAVRLLDGLDKIWLSSIVYMELLKGARVKKELQTIVMALEILDARIVHVDESISRKAIELIRQFAHSHGRYLAAALIAATAVQHGQVPVTGNDKHYSAIPELVIGVFRPGQ
jgi:predicted nucleic acid-binding protein